MEIKLVDDGIYASTISKLPTLFLGLGKQQCRNYVNQMELDPEYADGVIRPTQKTTIVIVDKFVDYLRKMDEGRFQR